MRTTMTALALLWSVGVAGCSDGANCNHSCPPALLLVTVPADRVGDIASVVATGPCVAPEGGGSIQTALHFGIAGEGVCHITISFKTGVPDFVGDVQLARPKECCQSRIYPNNYLSVPELIQLDASDRD